MSLHAEGWEGTASEYTLDKTETGYDNSTTEGNYQLGIYALDGDFGSTSTAIETLVHDAYGSTFTEILSEDGTVSEGGNSNTGDYRREDWGDRSADFVQYGTNADGSYHVTEGSAGTFDHTEFGNSVIGGYRLIETTDTDYSFTQEVSGTDTWTLTGEGNDTMIAVENGDRITGGYTRTEAGTDGYTLIESGTLSGGSFTQTVTGTDEYTTGWDGNQSQGTYERESTGGGTWTRTSSGAGVTLGSGNGTNGYTLNLAARLPGKRRGSPSSRCHDHLAVRMHSKNSSD